MKHPSKWLSISMMCAAAMLLAAACSSSSGNEPDKPGDPSVPVTPPAGQGNAMVIYEANPLFFASNNCLDAIEQRLPDIKSLDIDVLWLMPINTLGTKNAFGSPYCIRDYKGINPKYGTMADLKELVNKAHAQGMIVILDWVANHTAWDCPWITEHPDWYVQQNGSIISPPGMGWNDVAELNYNNADMRAEMIDCMLYWIREAGIDGYRCDYSEGVPGSFWTEAINAIRAVKADAFMLAESNPLEMYSYGFDMIYDWDYCTNLQRFMKGTMTFDRLVTVSDAKAAQVPAGKDLMRYVLNHDVVTEQSPQQLYGSVKAVLPAYVLTAFLGECPLIYSGMEAEFDNRTAFINATPLTWDPAEQARYVAVEKAYKNTAVARGGKRNIYDAGKGASFAWVNGSKAVYVVVNPTKAELTVKTPMAYMSAQMTDELTGESVKVPNSITLPAYGYAIYSK